MRTGRTCSGKVEQELGNNLVHRTHAQSSSTHPQKQGRRTLGNKEGGSHANVGVESLGGGLSKRNNALSAPFAVKSNGTLAQVNVVHINPNQLGDACAGGVKKLHHGAIAQVNRIPVCRSSRKSSEEVSHLLPGNDPGKVTIGSRSA